MGSLDVKRFKHFQNSLQSAMGVLSEGRRAPVGVITKEESTSFQAPRDEQSSDKESFDALDATKGIEAEYTSKGIQLTLDDELLFESGSAKITAEGLDLLLKISSIIKKFNRRIRIEGHTDNVPISTARYPSNWELSTERAITVVKYFISKGDISPHYLSAVGYGDSKPKTNNDSAQSRKKNRRVEIILGQVIDTKSAK
jgi:chemotaxis protein MotB